MTWFKVDDGFYDHPDVVRLLGHRAGRAALGLWVLAGSYSAHSLTNGRILGAQIARLGFRKAHAELLVTCGLWERCGRDYQFCNWLKYQPSKAAVRRKREAAKGRMFALRSREQNANEARTMDPIPDPDPRERGSLGPSLRSAPSPATSSAHAQEFGEAYRGWCFGRDVQPAVIRGKALSAAVEQAQAVAQRHGVSFATAVERLMRAAHARADRTGQAVSLALRDCPVPRPEQPAAAAESMAEWAARQRRLEQFGPGCPDANALSQAKKGPSGPGNTPAATLVAVANAKPGESL